ncbi:MAG: DUF2905 domain-containing protein [Clostridiales bacterium]|jgi:hypothetical protein|nr:DUF2905 domain-containing protein [Clostridiales bacterium]
MDQFGRLFLYIGGFFLLFGLALTLGGRLHLGRLPGDIIVRRENFVFYFPIMTGIVISLVLSFLFYILRRL